MSWLIKFITETILSILVVAVVGITACKVTVDVILEDESDIFDEYCACGRILIRPILEIQNCFHDFVKNCKIKLECASFPTSSYYVSSS